MTALAANQACNSCSPRKVKLSMDFPPHKQHLYSTQRGLPTKLVTAAWAQMMVAAPELPSRMTGGGRGRTQEDGKLTGPHYQNLPRHAVNSSSVGVQQGKMQMCQGITSVSALCHCGGLCSHN